MKKKILAVLMVAAMLFCILPVSALAAPTNGVIIAGATLNAGTPYYFNGGTISNLPENGGNSWNAWLEITGTGADAVYVLHMKGLNVVTDGKTVVETEIPLLYIVLEGGTTNIIKSTNDDTDSAAISAGSNLYLGGDGQLLLNCDSFGGGTTDAEYGSKNSYIHMQYPATLIAHGETGAISGSIGLPSGYKRKEENGYKDSSLTATENYKADVWVGDTQVTVANMNDVLGDGTVSYTPVTGASPAILELNGTEISIGMTRGMAHAGIVAEEPLVIKLSGNNTINIVGPGEAKSEYGIYSIGALTFEGTPGSKLSVSATVQDVDVPIDVYGIYSSGDITINNTSIDAYAGTKARSGIRSLGAIKINNSNVTAEAADAATSIGAIYANNKITLSETEVTFPKNAIFTNGADSLILDGTKIANKVIIGSPVTEAPNYVSSPVHTITSAAPEAEENPNTGFEAGALLRAILSLFS